MLNVTALPAFSDNYIWVLGTDNNKRIAVVDPGEARPVQRHLQQTGAELAAILVTHHHPDHTAGIPALLQDHDVPVYGPAGENHPVAGMSQALTESESISLDWLDLQLQVIDVPGHTAGHIALFGGGLLLCGDALFSAGCGKLFEGDAAQMLDSMSKLRRLDTATRIYCGHEYTEKNLLFAQAVEPDNQAIQQRLDWVREQRRQDLPSLPSDIGTERTINPFFRWDENNVIQSAQSHTGKALDQPAEVFAALRQWKDDFRPPA